MSTFYKWGKPLPEVDRAQVNPNALVMHDQQWGEVQYSLQFDPREPTAYDYELIINQFVHNLELECPEAEVKYVEASTGSNLLRVQFVHHGNSITLAAIAAILILVLKFVLTKIVAIAIASAILLAGYALYQRLKPNINKCHVCGEEFATYEDLAAHIEYKHPGAPVPDRPPSIWPDWPEYPSLVPFLIIGGVAIGAAILIPNLIRRK